MLEAESEAEDKSSRPRPRPRTKFWPRGQLGLEDLTSLDICSIWYSVRVLGQIKNVGMHRAGYHYLLATVVSSHYFTVRKLQ